MTTINDLFDYGLKIYQDTDYFKFSLDSILLAEFVKFYRNDKILDICTGNAPIPLILTTKDSSLKIDGIEIQKEVYSLATNSIQINGLEDRIHLYNEDAKTIKLKDKYDIVTCNPPYFKVLPSSEKNASEVKRIARHEVHITLSDVIDIAKQHLKETGTFYLVHRAERFLEATSMLEEAGFGIRDIAFIFTKKDKKAEFFLIEASKYKKSDPKIYGICTENIKTYQRLFEEV